ncbi:sporulation protein [Actinoplanes sp. NBRC 103695]|uniref:sporulation protein n=1 Tax=Actinoplanes sp. NBRC 103695 TaxID=3032202 RepID=UPI0024A2B643|nr:sporulation protein [Actinoplanes sp. NBRC 103695]GLY95270.1 sporulation protein [Actinoplanes sp. NBRC 103695]
MVFKKMLGALGVGGPSVDTVLSDPDVVPGGPIAGRVELVGGNHDVSIEHVTLGLVTRMEVESGGGDHAATGEFHRVAVSGPMRLAEGERASLPFRFELPWETPVTAVYGQTLRGMVMGVRTEVAIAKAVDKGDLDLINVHPLPLQQRILDGFAQLGFVFRSADLEYGRIHGVAQTLPFYQEIEYFAAPQYARNINEVELTFVTGPHGVEVVLEFDKRGGMFTGGHDSFGRYTVPHADADTVDWTQQVDAWVRQALDNRPATPGHGAPGHGASGHGMPGYGAPGFGGYHGHVRHRGGHGAGMGGVLAGAAGGMAAGYVAGEMIDDAFEGDGEE